MREIKFRVWNKEENKFFFFDISQNPKFWAEKIKDCPIQQYTGLKDKNENEIYEGDVVIQEKGTPYENIFLVEYGYGQFKINQNTNIFQTTEVIGNIYENPKLL